MNFVTVIFHPTITQQWGSIDMKPVAFVASIVLAFPILLFGAAATAGSEPDATPSAKGPDYDYRLWHEVCFEDGDTWPMEKLTDNIFVQAVYAKFDYATLRCGKVHGTKRRPKGWGYRKIFRKHGDEFRRHMRGIGPCHGGKDCIISEVIHRVLKEDYFPHHDKKKDRYRAKVKLSWKFKGNRKSHRCIVVFGDGNGAIITAYPRGR